MNKAQASHDALSPPWFLDSKNSMGAYKNPMTSEEKKFGEAIVEVRAIRHIQDWILKKLSLSLETKGEFLTQPNQTLKEHALKLFSYLRAFSGQRNLEDIEIGLTYNI